MAIERAVSRLLTADEAGQRLGLAPGVYWIDGFDYAWFWSGIGHGKTSTLAWRHEETPRAVRSATATNSALCLWTSTSRRHWRPKPGRGMLTQLRIVSDRCKNGAIGFVSLLLIGVVVSACGFQAWRDQALREVAEGRWHVDPEQVPPGSAPSQTIEFYDASGKHVGYGKVQGGTAELFNADGSRAGFGRLGR